MSDVVRSIFRQRKVEKLYELYNINNGFGLSINIEVCLRGRINDKNIIDDVLIGTYDVEIPMLEVEDKFFLHDISKVVEIKSRMRSSDGSITYYVKDELVETENTKKSYEECLEKIENCNCLKEKFDELKKEFDEYKRKYKYEHKFFNLN